MKIIKRDGSIVDYNPEKIRVAIKKANNEVSRKEKATEAEIEEIITYIEDLKKSREKLNNTTYFCYPFYEYNEYSIKMLKEAGFTMAFIGESTRSDNLVHVGSDKFRLRRFVIANITTINGLTDYFNQIK